MAAIRSTSYLEDGTKTTDPWESEDPVRVGLYGSWRSLYAIPVQGGSGSDV